MGGFGGLNKFETALRTVRRTINVRLRFDMRVKYLDLDQALEDHPCVTSAHCVLGTLTKLWPSST